MSDYKTIAESKNFIVLDRYTKEWQVNESYQSESELERELIQDLRNQGYEYVPGLNTPEALLANVRVQLQALNNVVFSDAEWQRFVESWLEKASDGIVEKTRKVHDDYIHDFVFDDGRIQNIYLVLKDEKRIAHNKLQVIKQFEQTGTQANRYDVTILVNGLPLVQVELKKRGVAIREAFNQVHRYSKESFNSANSLFKYLQLFVISNGSDTRYFANTTQRNKNSYDFTMNWAKADNSLIKDLKDFTATFFQKQTLLKVLLHYSVFDVSNTLLVMRPYQIAATERILWRIASTHHAKSWSKLDGGGFIWHTTGSGKTLTSFKAARLATELDFVDKVFFVVDRKDLDYQTMKEYQRFSPDSVNGSDSTAERSAIEARMATNALLLANKAKEPSLPAHIEPMSELLEAASKLIANANAAVAVHNEIAKNITKERADLTKQVWKYILEVELKAELKAYAGKRTGLNAAIASLNGQIQEANASKTVKSKEIKDLEKSATSIEPTIEGINGLLKSFGFRNFSIAKADDGPFYKLVRADGSDAKDSLSEGERSFVTFLYFFHLLKGSESESGTTADRIVVFDDPVSSMDSDVLFIVSSLVKSLFDPVRKNIGGIKQIFVLTHNVYFHKEVTYTSDRGGDAKVGERSYWTVRKGAGGTVVERHNTNPIKTSYDLLWEELRRPDKSPLTVQNTMRRILENYFKILGRMDFDEICDQFEGQQKAMCRSLFAWVNDGSHFSHDDAFYTFDQASIDSYLEIFKQVFEKTNQQAHYDMMMVGSS